MTHSFGQLPQDLFFTSLDTNMQISACMNSVNTYYFDFSIEDIAISVVSNQ